MKENFKKIKTILNQEVELGDSTIATLGDIIGITWGVTVVITMLIWLIIHW